MKRAVLTVAALLCATAARAEPYVVQSNTAACPRADALPHPTSKASGCTSLPANSRVDWDGKIIDGFAPHYLGGNVARVSASGKPVFVYANFLGAAPLRDPLRRDFVLARDAIACPSSASIADALEATAERDDKWFGESGCQVIPRGTSASRLEPQIAGDEPLWRMRVRLSQEAQPLALWMAATDFR